MSRVWGRASALSHKPRILVHAGATWAQLPAGGIRRRRLLALERSHITSMSRSSAPIPGKGSESRSWTEPGGKGPRDTPVVSVAWRVGEGDWMAASQHDNHSHHTAPESEQRESCPGLGSARRPKEKPCVQVHATRPAPSRAFPPRSVRQSGCSDADAWLPRCVPGAPNWARSALRTFTDRIKSRTSHLF